LRAQVKKTSGEASAAEVYNASCAGCHGVDRKGNPPSFPALLGLTKRMASQEIAQMIARGSGRMPGFEGSLSKTQIDGLTTFISDDNAKQATTTDNASGKTSDYVFQGYTKFLDPDGYPAVSTPWGHAECVESQHGSICLADSVR